MEQCSTPCGENGCEGEEFHCPGCNGGQQLGEYSLVDNPPELKQLLADIFDDEFMQENTTLENFTAFRFSSAVVVNWDADPLIYKTVLLDAFVQETTRFASWDEMVRVATDRHFSKKQS